MIALSAWLLVVGACDLLRATRDTITARHRWSLVGLGVAAFALLGLWVGLPGLGWLTVGVTWLVGLAGWLVCSSLALDPRRSSVDRWRGLAFFFLVAPALALGFVGDRGVPGVALPHLLDGGLLGRLGPEAALVVAGVLVSQLSTANIAVRLLLDAVGVPPRTNEKTLKGGRMLGPMERLFIVGLGVAGSIAAAAVVVAAKGLLRYPEIQRAQRDVGPTDVSEYFLIGSFASWLVAFGGLLVVWVGIPVQVWSELLVGSGLR